MPRFFFDLNDGQEVRDTVGLEVAGADEARVQAVELVGRYLQGGNRFPLTGGAVAVDARDDSGNHVLTARLALSIADR